MPVLLNRIGRIVSGEESGRFVKVIDDSKSTGGFYILTSDTPDMNPCFDAWVCNWAEVLQYFLESNWLIEWQSDQVGPAI